MTSLKQDPSGAGGAPPLPRPDQLDRIELVGKVVRLSDGRTGEVIHVEYEAPARVALVKTFQENPSPLTRASVDRSGPPHLPVVVELIGDARTAR